MISSFLSLAAITPIDTAFLIPSTAVADLVAAALRLLRPLPTFFFVFLGVVAFVGVATVATVTIAVAVAVAVV